MINKDNMTISEVSLVTGIPASTIRFYLREGLISLPIKKGRTRAYYNDEHIKQLKKIKQLRNKDKLSIKLIKRDHSFITEQAEIMTEQSLSLDRKNDIITAAIDLFRSKGFDRISIDDIVDKASISKATFYKHFSNKDELFYECADKTFYDLDREFNELLIENNIIQRLILRASLFIKTHRHMIDMLQLVRGNSISEEPKSKLKLNQIMANLTGPIAGDLEEGVRQGLFKGMNTTIVSHLLMGAVEYGIYYCHGKSDEEINQLIDQGVRLILRGIEMDTDNTIVE